jgi:hypothetical protein
MTLRRLNFEPQRLVWLLALLMLAGCSSQKPKRDVIARAGKLELTRSELGYLAGTPVDSLSAADRTRMISQWIERALVQQEGTKRKLDHDPDIAAKLGALRSELYQAKLLSAIPAQPPSDSVLQAYYTAHRSEFLRGVDAFLLELYWGPQLNTVAQFRIRVARGDTSQVATGEITAEGKWLAESGELDAAFERELTSLRPGEVTFPQPYEDGYRVARLLEVYPAGTRMDFAVVKDEIAARMLVEQSRARQDSLMTALRSRYPVTVFLKDS